MNKGCSFGTVPCSIVSCGAQMEDGAGFPVESEETTNFQKLLQGFTRGNEYNEMRVPHGMSFLSQFAPVAAISARIAGTFCRMRWFLRYARGEGRLCRQQNPILL